LFDRKPEYAIVCEVDLVVLRFDEEVSVFLPVLLAPERVDIGWACAWQ